MKKMKKKKRTKHCKICQRIFTRKSPNENFCDKCKPKANAIRFRRWIDKDPKHYYELQKSYRLKRKNKLKRRKSKCYQKEKLNP